MILKRSMLLVACVLLISALLKSVVTSSCSEDKSSSMCIHTTTLPHNKQRFMPSIGNGRLATIVMSDTVHMAGVYNGPGNITQQHKPSTDTYTLTSHRARIPSTAAINFTLQIKGRRSYSLDMESGVFEQRFKAKGVRVGQKIYAHRRYENVIVNEISAQSDFTFTIKLTSNRGSDSKDINFQEYKVPGQPFKASVGAANVPEVKFVTRVATVWTPIPHSLTITKGRKKTIRFITVVTSNLEQLNPIASAIDIWKKMHSQKDLFPSHAKEWKSLWKSSNISMKGNDELAQLVTSSLYYTLSQVNRYSLNGISPGGLAGGEEYLGHVFWDQDVWMYPSLLMLQPSIARALLTYRQKRLEAAKQIAAKYKYKGAMYPWESALTGLEVCPEDVYGLHEIHINGDIALAQRQYYYATGDIEWLKHKGYEVIFQTATFWASRVKFDVTRDCYVINDVMPPDEYAYPVNNSIYTNTIAKLNLEMAIDLGKLLDIPTPKNWKTIASKIYLPYDEKLDYHPEYEGFDITKDKVKQADAILINYPLMAPLSKTTKENNLRLYANVTNPDGPAMTHSMFAIGWLDIEDLENARVELEKNYQNVKGPFKVWSELRSGKGATNFMTGAGGLLQSILFGYGGLRLKSNGLYFKLQVPPKVSELKISGIKYMKNDLQFHVSSSSCSVRLMKSLSTQPLLIKHGGKETRMVVDRPVHTCGGKLFVAAEAPSIFVVVNIP